MAESEPKLEGRAIAIPHPAVTNDGVVTTHYDVYATSAEVGADFAARVEADSGHMTHDPVLGDVSFSENGVSFTPGEGISKSGKSSKSFANAWGRDPKGATWEPKGPKAPGKPRSN